MGRQKREGRERRGKKESRGQKTRERPNRVIIMKVR